MYFLCLWDLSSGHICSLDFNIPEPSSGQFVHFIKKNIIPKRNKLGEFFSTDLESLDLGLSARTIESIFSSFFRGVNIKGLKLRRTFYNSMWCTLLKSDWVGDQTAYSRKISRRVQYSCKYHLSYLFTDFPAWNNWNGHL